MNGLLYQLQTFILTGLTGVAAGFILHYYQLTVSKAGVGKLYLYLLDLIWWIFILLMVFAAMLVINQGEIRFYIILTLFAGVILYFSLLAARLTRVVERGAKGTVFIVASFSRLASFIPGWLKKFVSSGKETDPPPPPG